MIIDLDIQSPVCGPSGLACVEAVMAGRVPEEECLERCEGTITEVEKLHSARSEGDWGLVLEYYEKYKGRIHLENDHFFNRHVHEGPPPLFGLNGLLWRCFFSDRFFGL